MEEIEVHGKGEVRNRSNRTDLSADGDRTDLANIGKKQVLKRRFGFMSMIGFSCTLMATWAGLLTYFAGPLMNGGSAGSVYGFIFSWFGVITVMCSLAELASMAPTAGGQYHYVAMLSPESCQKILSYIAGWATVCAWQATVSAVCLPLATIVQGLVILNYPNYAAERWHATLMAYAFILLALFVNTYLNKYFNKIEGMILILYIIGFFGVVISLSALSEHITAEAVFHSWNNGGGWESMSLAWFVSLAAFAGAFAGADGATHMAEEIHNASVVVPRSMVTSVIINGVFGFAALIAILFSITDLEGAFASPTGYPFMAVFQSAAGVKGATVMTCTIVCLGTFGSWALLATASRQMWAFARDNGLPGSGHLSRIEPKSALPWYAIAVTIGINFLIPLIYIGSATGFNAVISLLVSSFYISFVIPCYLLLWRRLSGAIKEPTPGGDTGFKNTPGSRRLIWGPWRMPKIVGIVFNAIACGFATIILAFSCFPSTAVVDKTTMNYSSVVTGGVIVLAMVYYVVHGRKVYLGPTIEIEA
ncbi:amino acid permease [Aaosphaeria arxii CBS 175.79]|uniref:Amino acid permease n=1 Tax=Aaosphaeria arxii CBS 175.79 TaxID=1450172 RepID=A0A6A5XEI3_9PLEO|nr:amino acid permease [Aaosphaeria arxii CBS 175.79]KAF2011281.1 amino acid permease [Aaosphaeria arxii CBS 175.79]